MPRPCSAGSLTHAGSAGARRAARWRRSRCIGCRSRAAPLAKTNCLAATVDHVSYLGPFIQIAVRIGDTVLESHQPSSRETETLRAGDAVHAAWDADDVVLIPAQRG